MSNARSRMLRLPLYHDPAAALQTEAQGWRSESPLEAPGRALVLFDPSAAFLGEIARECAHLGSPLQLLVVGHTQPFTGSLTGLLAAHETIEPRDPAELRLVVERWAHRSPLIWCGAVAWLGLRGPLRVAVGELPRALRVSPPPDLILASARPALARSLARFLCGVLPPPPT